MLASGTLLVALAAAEFGNRLRLWCLDRPYDSAASAETLARLRDPMSFFVPPGSGPVTPIAGSVAGILHPYTGAEKEHDTGGVLEHFHKGKAPNEYSVLVVGGSVAGAWAMPGPDKDAFERRLSRDPRFQDRDIVVLNYAHAAYKQPQQLMRVAYLLSLGYKPDAVINIDGFNELTGGLDNARSDMNPVYPAFTVWGMLATTFKGADENQLRTLSNLWQLRVRADDIARTALDWGMHHSSLLGSLAIHLLVAVNRERQVVQDELISIRPSLAKEDPLRRQAQGPDFPSGHMQVLKLSITNWFESSLSLDALLRARSIPYLHVLQPALLDEGSKPIAEAERSVDLGPPEWKSGIKIGYPGLREQGQELAARGVAFVDATQIFAGTEAPVYCDACHLVSEGSALLGKRIAREFLRMLPQNLQAPNGETSK